MKKLHSRFALLLVAAALTASAGLGQLRVGKFGVGFNAAAYMLQSDFTSESVLNFGGGIGMTWSIMENVGIRANLAGGQLAWKEGPVEYITMITGANFYMSGDLLPHGKLNPFVFAGVGVVYFDPRPVPARLLTSNIDKIDINYMGGAGVDYFFSEFISMTLSGEIGITNTDNLDASKVGGNNDYYYRANLEFRYYFFDQDFITKLLEAMKARK